MMNRKVGHGVEHLQDGDRGNENLLPEHLRKRVVHEGRGAGDCHLSGGGRGKDHNGARRRVYRHALPLRRELDEIHVIAGLDRMLDLFRRGVDLDGRAVGPRVENQILGLTYR